MMANELQVSAVKLDAKRVQYVSMEGIRGIAAIWVAVRHTMSLVYPVRSQTNFLAVDLFFLLSGFVLAYSYERRLRSREIGILELSLMRIIRIYPLYILGSLFGLMLFALRNDRNVTELSLIALKSIFFVPTLDGRDLFFPLDYPAWSLFFELVASFFYAGLMFRLGSRTILALSVLCGFIFIYGIFHHGSADIGYQSDTVQYGFARIGFSFSLGVLIFRGRAGLATVLPKTGNVGTLLVFALTSFSLMLPVRHVGVFGAVYDTLALVVVFPAILVLATRATPSGIVEKLGLFLGNVSYPVYVFHVPISGLAIEASRRLAGIDLARYAPLSGLVVFIVLFAMAIVLNEIYDVPLRRRLRSIVVRRLFGPALQAPS